jgi:hypothetical protein
MVTELSVSDCSAVYSMLERCEMKSILNFLSSDKKKLFDFCETHAFEIASKFRDLSKDYGLKVDLKNAIQYDYNYNEELFKLRSLIREKLVSHVSVKPSIYFYDRDFDQERNAILGIIDRSGSYSVLSFTMCSLSSSLNGNREFQRYIGSVLEIVRDVLDRFIPSVYVLGNLEIRNIFDLAEYYRMDYNNLINPPIIEPSVWGQLYGKDRSLWSAQKGSYLKNVDLTDWGITVQQVNSAFGDASVVLPNNVKPGDPSWPSHWPIWNIDFWYDGWFDSDKKYHIAPPGFQAEWRKWQSDPYSYRPPMPPQG